jgi:hypothetical protein
MGGAEAVSSDEAKREQGDVASASVTPTPPPVESETWQLVLTGAIDHRLHVPRLYKASGVLSDHEYTEAMKSANLGPVFNAFFCSSFLLMVNPDRWQIETGTKEFRGRLIEIAETIFDVKLFETPLTAYGINANITRKTRAPRVDVVIDRILDAPLGVLPSNEINIIVQKNFPPDRSITTGYQTFPPAPDFILLRYNAHYSITHYTDYFKIGDELQKNAENGWKDAELFAEKTVSGINRHLEE